MRLTERVISELEQLLETGDMCIDATAGNGHDTATMAGLVGESGKVFAIDIQETAIDSTKSKLEQLGFGNRCEYLLGDHAKHLENLLNLHRGEVRAITFNLGYLPGSDKKCITKPQTTLAALHSATQLLGERSALFITAYRGHSGGLEEANIVENFIQHLEKPSWHIENYAPKPRIEGKLPPVLWIARRKAARRPLTKVQ